MPDLTPAPVVAPVVLKPVSLTGETWDRLRQAAYAIPEGKKGGLIAAASLDEHLKPKADLLFVHRVGTSWYLAGSVGWLRGQPTASVMTTYTW